LNINIITLMCIYVNRGIKKILPLFLCWFPWHWSCFYCRRRFKNWRTYSGLS